MITIEPLGTGGQILPAFIIGYDVTGNPDDQLRAAVPESEGPIVHIYQQAGGYGMSYPGIVGAVLRLEANRERGRRPLDPLIRGFRAMAEDPDMKVLEEYPLLRRMVYTRGGPYSRADLHALGQLLGRYVRVPSILSGIEAFIRFEPCDVLAYFAGWRALSCRAVTSELSFEEVNLNELAREDSTVFASDLIDRIRDVGKRLGRDQPPGLFLLWENSD